MASPHVPPPSSTAPPIASPTPTPTPSPPSLPAALLHQVQSGLILNGTAVLVLLYFGREVLVPTTLAILLSLLVAPLVRRLRRVGLGQVPSVLGAVLTMSLFVLGLAAVIGSQVVSMASSLPQYETTIRAKVKVVQEITLGRMEAMQGEAGRMMHQLAALPAGMARAPDGFDGAPRTSTGVVPVEIHERPLTPVEVMSHVFSSVWGPLGKAGVVLVILVFVLLEHESLRDRFIRLVGGGDLRRTTHAFNDAGERLSRFFVSQFAVNLGVGAVIWAGLAIIGVPHGLLWAVLTTVLRVVPYVGVFVAAFSAALLAAAVDVGWMPMIATLGLFAVVEIIASQVVEPQLYGHSTGLSPLSVVLAAIFWSWLWGAVGLLVSTPLTLCLVVAGRHIAGLGFLDILLGDGPALSMPERFYQRALSGDADEIIVAAKDYLKRKSFARYCDRILMPALRLAGADLACNSITPQQQTLVRGAIVQVIEALGPDARKRSRWQRRVSVLDEDSLGAHLRHRREDAIGQYQGPLAVPAGSIVLCIGLGSLRDDLVTEILVRILRDLDIDARHISLEDIERGPPPGATAGGVSMLFLVSAFPTQEWPRAESVLPVLRTRFTDAVVVGLLPEEAGVETGDIDLVARSFEEAAAHAVARYPESGKPGAGGGEGTVAKAPGGHRR